METEIKDRFTELYKENQVVMDELSRFFRAFLKYPDVRFFCNLPIATNYTVGEEGWLFCARWFLHHFNHLNIDRL